MAFVLTNLPLDLRKYIQRFINNYNKNIHTPYLLIQNNNLDGIKYLWKYHRNVILNNNRLLWWTMSLGSPDILDWVYNELFISKLYVEYNIEFIWQHGSYFSIISNKLDIIKWLHQHSRLSISVYSDPLRVLFFNVGISTFSRSFILENMNGLVESSFTTLFYIYDNARYLISDELILLLEIDGYLNS